MYGIAGTEGEGIGEDDDVEVGSGVGGCGRMMEEVVEADVVGRGRAVVRLCMTGPLWPNVICRPEAAATSESLIWMLTNLLVAGVGFRMLPHNDGDT